ARRLAHWPHLLFLDSAARDSPFGRYSFITADPFDWLRSRGQDDNPFPRLAECLTRWRTETLPDLPPFQGGVAGLFGYDLCHQIERLPRPLCDEFALPELAAGCYDWVLAFDHRANRSWIISTGLPETQPWRRRHRAAQRLRAVRHAVGQAEPADAFP